ncbi:MAG TPA: PAS domain S-box protein, partial [Syntrophales bacterium]|nr:PAS domain S-box protein [Syntrophales bacterium]
MKRSLTGFYVVQDGRFQYVNFNAASYAGYTPEELVGKKADVLIHPDDTVQVKKTAREMLRRQRTTPQEFRIFTKKGDVRWVKETVTGILYEGRRTILGSSIDITEYKQAEEALSESRQRLGDIIEFLPDTTFVIDLEGKLIAWNRAAEDLTGMKAKDVLGKGDFHYAQPFWKKRRPMSINLVLKSNRRYEET